MQKKAKPEGGRGEGSQNSYSHLLQGRCRCIQLPHGGHERRRFETQAAKWASGVAATVDDSLPWGKQVVGKEFAFGADWLVGRMVVRLTVFLVI